MLPSVTPDSVSERQNGIFLANPRPISPAKRPQKPAKRPQKPANTRKSQKVGQMGLEKSQNSEFYPYFEWEFLLNMDACDPHVIHIDVIRAPLKK